MRMEFLGKYGECGTARSLPRKPRIAKSRISFVTTPHFIPKCFPSVGNSNANLPTKQMKLSRLLLPTLCACAGAPFALAGPAVPITNLFNTGVNALGVPLTDNTPDIHYTFAVPPPTGSVPIVTTSAGGFPIGPWLGDNTTSAWLTPSFDTTGNVGNYTYRTTFTIPAGVDPSQVYVRGQLTSDNGTSGVLINGLSTGITGSGNFPAFDAPFTIAKGFVAGVNTLDFVVNEATGQAGAGGFTGLRVEMGGARGPAGHVSIPGLINTGVAVAEGAPLPEDSLDTHYVMAGAASGAPFVTTSAGGFPIPPWVGDSQNSAWVTPAPDTNGPDGDYFYSLIFDLTGLDPSTASIFGQWSVDNTGVDILLNGAPTGNANPNGFGGFTDFNISAAQGALFSAGLNTLTFQVNNGAPPGPTGLRVDFLSATAAPLVPEPSSAWLLATGLGFFASRRRTR